MRLHQPTVQELQNALASAKTCVSKIEEALGTTGKPGSGPEFPPEGYRLQEVGEQFICTKGVRIWSNQQGRWCAGWVRPDIIYKSTMSAIAVPISPKPEPVKLSDQEKVAGWRGPTGFRLQAFQNRSVECVICKQTIKAGERLARWRIQFPESACQDHKVGHPSNEENHAHAHVDCLYKSRHAAAEMYHLDHLFRSFDRIRIRSAWASAAMAFPGAPMRQLDYAEHDVPKWLQEKREKFDKQN